MGGRERGYDASVRARAVVLSLLLLALPLAAQQPSTIPTPEAHFGFRMGADGRLAAAADIEKYFEAVAAGSDRVKIVDLGPTTEGRRTIAAIVSAPENIRNLDRIRADNQRLADPRTLPEDDARRLAATHKVVVAIGCSIHATEIGASQAANELLHELATSNDPAVLGQLRDVVLIVIPMLNPDGHRLVVDWYDKYKGTVFDGVAMPWADHKYAGHDINRDGFMMNLAENRNLSRLFYTEWHPQVFLAMHQMENEGPRFFAPPNADPIDANYDPIIWREAALLGSAMTLELERDQRAGVMSSRMFDYYFPGYEDSAPLGHNTVCLLTEAAGVRIASPLEQTPAEPRGRIGAPHPWPGGRWSLRDVVDYDLSAVHGLLRAASAYRGELVQNFYGMGLRAVEAGRRGGPFAFVIPPEQRDPLAVAKLEELLVLGGIEIERTLEPFRADETPYPAGSDLILLSQPYRSYVKTLLERQDYPAAVSANQRPYDVAGWTLPAQMGVDVRTIARPFEPPSTSRVTAQTLRAPSISSSSGTLWGDRKPGHYYVETRGNAGAIAVNRVIAAGLKASWTTRAATVNGYVYPAGSLVVPAAKAAEPALAAIARQLSLRVDGVKGKPSTLPSFVRPADRARVALYKPWADNSDEGWTRWLLEQYEFPFSSISNAEVRAGNLRARYDAIILPSAAPALLLDGEPLDAVPPEYAGGIGEAGVRELDAFVRAGGTLVCLDQACAMAVDAFKLPIRDVTRLPRDQFFCPGSLVRLELDPTQPLAFGMPPQTSGFFADSSAYELLPEAMNVEIIARYPAKDVLVSGWLEGERVMAGRAAIVSAAVGSGRVVLFGFRVQHRAQTLATFRLLFNTIFSAR
jgi:hypothetical protein